jgi:hypothetical protein
MSDWMAADLGAPSLLTTHRIVSVDRFAHKVVGHTPSDPRSQAPAWNAYPEAPPPQRPGKASNIKDALTVADLSAPNMSGQSSDDMGSQAGAWEPDFWGVSRSAELRA